MPDMTKTTGRLTRWAWMPLTPCFVILTPTTTSAVGFRLPNQDPQGIARGNAFVATAENSSAICRGLTGITHPKRGDAEENLPPGRWHQLQVGPGL